MSLEPISWLFLLLLGSFTGILAGIFGLGGGFLIVPVLTLWGVPVVETVGTSLISVVLTAISGSLQNWWRGQLHWRDSLQLAMFGIPTAQFGAWCASWVPERWLASGFAFLLIVTLFLIHWRDSFSDRTDPDNSDRALPDLKPQQWKKFAQIGAISGILSGLFGIGGGIIMVPLQILVLDATIESAVPTSLGAVVAIAASGLIQHTWQHHVLWIPGLCLGMGGMVGAQVGTRLLRLLPATLVNRLFQLVLLVLALYRMQRGLAIQLI